MSKKPKIKILVGYHKPADLLKDDILTPIHLGRALATESSKDGQMSQEEYDWMCENMIGDDLGDNISYLNRYFNELTGIYWAWKNYDKLGNPDYIGFTHYRRQFIFKKDVIEAPRKWADSFTYKKIDYRYKDITNIKYLDNIADFDLIIPELFDVRNRKEVKVSTVIENLQTYCKDIASIKNFTKMLSSDDRLVEYSKYVDFSIQPYYYLANMFIMKKEMFFEYCNFLFYVVFRLWELRKETIICCNDMQQIRQIGYVAEFITTVFINKQIDLLKKVKVCPISFIENTSSAIVDREINLIKIKNQIKNFNIISFDIFDTLLLRPYHDPFDVFKHLELHYNLKDFYSHRIVAEKKARTVENKSEVNYDDIYNNMPEVYKFLREKEQELEFNTIFVNPEMLDIFNFAISENKKVILITDMYYNDIFLERLLKKNGIVGYDKLYVSSTVGKSKRNLELFTHVLDDLNIKEEQMLHIGDNDVADYKNPISLNIQALLYERPRITFFKLYPKIWNYYSNDNQSFSRRIIANMLFKKWLNNKKQINNYWEYFGYFYCGAICYAISKFVYKEAIKNNLSDMLFIARDGFIIKEIVELLDVKKNLKCNYVIASRIIKMIVDLDIDNLTSSESLAVCKIFKEHILNTDSADELNHIDRITFIKSNLSQIMSISKEARNSYEKYIHNFDFKSENLGLFDLSASSFSSYKLISNILNNKKITALYLNVANRNYKNFINFVEFNTNKRFIKKYLLSELIITAPELPVKFYTKNGVFLREENHFENKRIEIYNNLYPKELEFAKDILNTFKNFDIDIDCDSIIELQNNFVDYFDDCDLFYFNDIYHGVDLNHTQYEKIFTHSDINTLKMKKNNINGNFNIKFVGAKNRVCNHLQYKLGKVLLEARNPFKALILPYSIVSTIFKHKRKTKNYLELISEYPNLKLPKLEEYSDYIEAKKTMNNLPYKLGGLFLKHPFSFIFKVKKFCKEHHNATR